MVIRRARPADLPPLPLQKSARQVITEARNRPTTGVFLSHSQHDEDELARAEGVLTSHGATVYIDKLDPATKTNVEIASHLRMVISGCTRLVAVGSKNLASSRWIPWELGMADGMKGLQYVAIFPIDQSATLAASIEQEYLQNYPQVMLDESLGQKEWKVLDPRDQKVWKLKDWLTASSLK